MPMTIQFKIQCRGRNSHGDEVLERPIDVTINVYQVEDTISSSVVCQYKTGRKCTAAGRPEWKGKCPYSFDIPHMLEQKTLETPA